MINVTGNAETIIISNMLHRYVLHGRWQGRKFICDGRSEYDEHLKELIGEMTNLRIEIIFPVC